MNSMNMIDCPLCAHPHNAQLFFADRLREYRQCPNCLLVFVPSQWHLSAANEKAEYDLHDNRMDDDGYAHFLARLAQPLLPRMPANSICLDYGCGPAPLLARLLSNHQHQVSLYDPFYADDPQALKQQYDVITCSEVIEHFRQPGLEFARLFSLLKPNGILGLMTKRVRDQTAFSRWHYKNDPTHISFFSETTLIWLADRYQCAVDFVDNDVAILTRHS